MKSKKIVSVEFLNVEFPTRMYKEMIKTIVQQTDQMSHRDARTSPGNRTPPDER